MREKQLTLPFIPYHIHDSDITPYLGSEMRGDTGYDYYYSPQGGHSTVIARFGENGDYISGLLAIKSQLDKNKDIIPQLNALKNGKDEEYSILATATLLSIEQGYLGLDLKAITPNATQPTHRRNKVM